MLVSKQFASSVHADEGQLKENGQAEEIGNK